MMMARRRRADYDNNGNNDGGASASKDVALDPLYSAALLTPAQERALFTAYQRTHDAQLRDQLILANTRLVRSLARRYHPHGITREDLEHEGLIGLIRAVENYDLACEYAFSTIATGFIKQAMSHALAAQNTLIREPEHVQRERRRAERLGEPTIPPWYVVALDSPASPGDPHGLRLEDVIAGSASTMEHLDTDWSVQREALTLALGRLSGRERYVIELRYGLTTGGDNWTLEKVGETMQVTKQYVWAVEMRALRKLRQMLTETSEGELALRQLDELTAARKKRKPAAKTTRQNVSTTLLAS